MSKSLLIVVLVCACLAGCGGEAAQALPADGVVVTGEVKWRNKPLVWGVVQLTKVDAPNEGASADIVDGKYKVIPERRLKPGKYRVMVFGGLRKQDNPELTGPVADSEPNPNVVPPEHGERSKLTFDVKPDVENKLNLNLR